MPQIEKSGKTAAARRRGATKTAKRTRAKLGTEVRSARQAIFETAERLCGEQGLEAVSVRDIAAAAQVNLAAVNYYFGSRSNLLLEIVRTRGAELGAERKRLVEEFHSNTPMELRPLLKAIIAPLWQWRRPGSGRQSALMFMSRALLTAVPEIKREIDGGVVKFNNYIEMIHKLMPKLSKAEICWRFHFMMAIEHMNIWDDQRLKLLSAGSCKTEDHDEALERAIDFAVAGFMAPARSASRKGT